MIEQLKLTLGDAHKMVSAAECEARNLGIDVSITICDSAGHLILFQRMDNAALITISIAMDKARLAAMGRYPTKIFEQAIAHGMPSLAASPVMQGALEGGVPIVVREQVVGGIAASGGSGEEDAAIASAGAAALEM